MSETRIAEMKMSEKEMNAVRRLRLDAKNSGLLTPYYDTDYNLLRWAIGYGYNLPEATKALIRHLKVRRFYNLDEAHLIDDDPVTSANFPLGLVGMTGKDNRFLVIECAGKVDLVGLLKSVQITKFLLHRLKFQERILRLLNESEKKHGTRCAGIYVLDMDGLSYDPSLLPIVTGPYAILWGHIYTNYPEWLSSFMVINAPWFTTMMWKAISPMLPEITRNKVSIYSKPSEWQAVLRDAVVPENLPAHWGGEMVDKFGDPMCRALLNIPEGKVPDETYWKPSRLAPHYSKLDSVILSPGGVVFRSYKVRPKSINGHIYFVLNRYCDRVHTFAAYFTTNMELGTTTEDITQMQDWATDFHYPGMSSTDYLKVRMPGAGMVTIKFGNENSWFRSLSVHFRVSFCDSDGNMLPFIGSDGKLKIPKKRGNARQTQPTTSTAVSKNKIDCGFSSSD